MPHLIIVIVKAVAPPVPVATSQILCVSVPVATSQILCVPVPVATSQILCVSVVLTGVENMAAASEEDAALEPPTPSPTPPLDNEL